MLTFALIMAQPFCFLLGLALATIRREKSVRRNQPYIGLAADEYDRLTARYRSAGVL